jgi:glutamyl/glutaminyl-tRNA synthetase
VGYTVCMVTTRFAPSPTGFLHIGSIRTALLNYVYAKSRNGKFILRIEDTDQSRLVTQAIQNIHNTLDKFGIVPDEIYQQSERLEIYMDYANRLLSDGLAYRKDGAIFLRIESPDKIVLKDFLKGNIELPGPQDTVIIKSDGYPTYHFANVIDDYFMDVDTVIRGEEWVTSTNIHLSIYKALGWVPPSFGHIPLILDVSGKKLSKRHSDSNLKSYFDDGYLPKAIACYCLMLGDGTKTSNKKLFSMSDAINDFDIFRYKSVSPKLDKQKLVNMNFKALQELSDQEFLQKLEKFYKFPLSDSDNTFFLKNRSRIKTLRDIIRFVVYSAWFAYYPNMADEDILRVVFPVYNCTKDIKFALKVCHRKTHYSLPQIYKSVRMALSNEENGPDLQDLCDYLSDHLIENRLSLFGKIGTNLCIDVEQYREHGQFLQT